MAKHSESIEDIIVLATRLDKDALFEAGAQQKEIDALTERLRGNITELLAKHEGHPAAGEAEFINCFWSSEKDTEKVVKFIEEFRAMSVKELTSILPEGKQTDFLYHGVASGTSLVSRQYKKTLFKKRHTGTELYGDLVNRSQYFASYGRNHNLQVIIGEELADWLPGESLDPQGEIDYKNGSKQCRVFSLKAKD